MNFFNKIYKHFKAKTLGLTLKKHLRKWLNNFIPVFWYELGRKKFNGGFYEKPRPDASYIGEDASCYYEKRAKLYDWQNEQLAMEELLRYLNNSLKVLDVPFGTGRFIQLYKAKNMKIYGLEKSSEMIAAAEKLLGEDFNKCTITIGDATKLPYKDNMFDLVVCFRYLPHIINFGQAKQTLSEFYRVSKKYIIIQLGEREKHEYRRRLPRNNEKMESWLYPNEVEQLLNHVRFRIIKKTKPLKSATTTTAKYVKNIGNWHAFLCEKL